MTARVYVEMYVDYEGVDAKEAVNQLRSNLTGFVNRGGLTEGMGFAEVDEYSMETLLTVPTFEGIS